MIETKRVAIAVIFSMIFLGIPNAAAEKTLSVSIDDEIIQMKEEEYLVGVLAAEMPALYHMEALKAQAVAARTRIAASRCLNDPEADVCGDSSCCQGYLNENERHEKWGAETDSLTERLRQAVHETEDIIMLYNGEPIEVLYHAVSGGQTEDVEDVFSEALPYLRSVESPGEESASGYSTEQVFTKQAIVDTFPDAVVNGKLQLEILERSKSGRVILIRVGRFTMPGRLFRSALGLKSTNFELSMRDDQIIITQKGYGHGVGMSQAGANAMAQAGLDYRSILAHYYTGISFGKLDDVHE